MPRQYFEKLSAYREPHSFRQGTLQSHFIVPLIEDPLSPGYLFQETGDPHSMTHRHPLQDLHCTTINEDLHLFTTLIRLPTGWRTEPFSFNHAATTSLSMRPESL